MKEISKERMGEIALAILKQKVREDRIPNIQNLKREIGNDSKEIRISKEDLLSFWVGIYSEVFSEIISTAKNNFEPEENQESPMNTISKRNIVGFKR